MFEFAKGDVRVATTTAGLVPMALSFGSSCLSLEKGTKLGAPNAASGVTLSTHSRLRPGTVLVSHAGRMGRSLA